MSFNVLASSQDEITHLLSYVKSTDCQYERNGTMHNGEEAAKHINKKYQYYIDDIKSTEDFIRYSATKSTMSGKFYRIHCPNKAVVRSQQWLLTELQAFRLKQE